MQSHTKDVPLNGKLAVFHKCLTFLDEGFVTCVSSNYPITKVLSTGNNFSSEACTFHLMIECHSPEKVGRTNESRLVSLTYLWFPNHCNLDESSVSQCTELRFALCCYLQLCSSGLCFSSQQLFPSHLVTEFHMKG